MRNLLRNRFPAFKHAFSGLTHVIKTQKNAWIHALATIVTIALAILLRLSLQKIAILILVMGLVWTAEIFNTSLEAIVDMISPHKQPLAKIAKDTGAAAVLVSAITSIIIGVILLGPPLISELITLFQK
jgi:diacylglycerol kinase (ATP)